MGQRAAAAVSAALGGRGGVLLLTGEAGIGKTHLARSLHDEARTTGATVVWTRAGRAGAPAFWPWVETLRTLGLGDLLGAGADSGPTDLRTRFDLFEAVHTALVDKARAHPTLVVLDDLHLADSATLLLTAHLAQGLAGVPLAVVATVRNDVTPSAPEWPAVWADLLRSSSVVAVTPLSAEDVSRIAAEEFGTSPSPAQVQLVLDRTGGNALYARELLSLGAQGEFLDVPNSVRALVGARVARRSAECRRVLGLAAVTGVSAPIALLVEVLGQPMSTTLDVLEEAAGEGLIGRPDAHTLRFSHEIVRDAVYDSVPLAQRAQWHEAVAATLASGADAPAAEIADHLRQSGPSHAAASAEWWQRAGSQAMAAMAYEEAARCFENALATGIWSGRLNALLGDARLAYGDSSGARAAYLEAATIGRRAGDAHVLAQAALGLGSGPAGFEVSLQDRDQIDTLTDALKMLPADESALRARLLARLSVALTFSAPVAERAELADQARALAIESHDDAALALALASRCDVLGGPAHAHERLELTTRVIELALKLHDSTLELLGRRMRLVARLELGDTIGFTEDVRAFAVVARSLGQPLYLWYVPLWQAMAALYEGRPGDCATALAEATALARAAGSVNAQDLIPTLRWCIASESGGRDVQATFEALAAEGLVLDGIDAQWVPFTKALIAAQTGRLDEARNLLDVAAPGAVRLPVDGNWLATFAQTAEVIGLIGAHPLAEFLYESLAPYADLFVVEGIGAGLRGSVHRHLGLLARAMGREAEAADHFAAAIAANERTGLPVLVEWARREAGRATPAPAVHDAVFRLDGEHWTLGFRGTTVSMRDSKGLRDLVRLLAEPDRPFAAVDLAGSDGRAEQSGLGDVVDADARAAYRRRLAELEEEEADADASGDAAKSERLAAERDALVAQLSAAYGLGGRARQAGSTVERARTTVTARIRDSIRRIEAVHPALGRHLQASVKTGTTCVYSPAEPVEWVL